MATLEHLTLYSDRPLGLCPALDLSAVHFPRLKSLALGNYTFCHDDQLDWILAHGATLRELYLDNCLIIHHSSVLGWKKRSLSIQVRRESNGSSQSGLMVSNDVISDAGIIILILSARNFHTCDTSVSGEAIGTMSTLLKRRLTSR